LIFNALCCPSPPSFVPPPLYLHNRLVGDCVVGKEEVLKEGDIEMEVKEDLLAPVFQKKIIMNPASAEALPILYQRFQWRGMKMGRRTCQLLFAKKS
jgi:hypothetical protein